LQSKHLLLTKKKTISADSVEQQILSLERQRRELLEVNKQWDHQFRRMKQHYEKKLAEMKAKLDMSQRRVSELEEERYRNHPENERLRVLGRDGPLQETKDIKVLTDALHEIKEENKLLKEKNASMIRRKEHYECEISRLNKALLGILKKQHSSVLENPSEKSGRSSLEDMQTQLEVLRQQVQIYEEDFRKERSDRERLNEEKEALQKINESLQSQLSKRHSQIETCVKEKEQLERQLQQQEGMSSPASHLHCFSHHALIMGTVGCFFTIKILEYIQCLAGHMNSNSAHQTISGMFLISFRQMCSTRQMVRQQ
ncbi:TNFAIP3-interacting protein 3, partial [Struthio camelus australis]